MLEGIWPRCSRPIAIEAAQSAAPEDPWDAVPLLLKSTDGETVRTTYGVAKQSLTIGCMAHAQGGTADLSQPLEVQLRGKMLRAVVNWCDFHKGDPPLKLSMRPIRRRYDHFYLSDEERRYFDDHYLALWDLAAAADYLNVPRLYYSACMTLYLLAKKHCSQTLRLILAMGGYEQITAKCHVVPRNVSISIYCDVLRFDDDYTDCFDLINMFGGYLTTLVRLHGAVLPPQLMHAHIVVSEFDDYDQETNTKTVCREACIDVHKFVPHHGDNYHLHDTRVWIEHLSRIRQYALTEFYVHDISDDVVLALLKGLLSGSHVVACETLNVQWFSFQEQSFCEQTTLVRELLNTLRHVEALKLKLTPRQLVAFLPAAVDFSLPPHVALRIKVNNHDGDEIDNYDAHQWLQLLRVLEGKHGNAISIRLKQCSLAESMLRALHNEYLSAKNPTGVELLIEPPLDENQPNRIALQDVQLVAVELGLQLLDEKEVESRTQLYRSAARKGHKFSAAFVNTYDWTERLILRIVKD